MIWAKKHIATAVAGLSLEERFRVLVPHAQKARAAFEAETGAAPPHAGEFTSFIYGWCCAPDEHLHGDWLPTDEDLAESFGPEPGEVRQ